MKQLKETLAVEKAKETLYSGGNICVSSCGNFMFCIFGASVNVIDVSTGETVNRLESEEEEITAITISPDDQHLITAHRNLLLKQWTNWKNADEPVVADSPVRVTTKCARTWKAIHSAPVQYMTFDHTSSLLATASSDFTTKIWDINGQYCTHNLKGAQGIVTYVRFHPLIHQNAQCITGSEDGKLRVYNLNKSQLETVLDGHYSAITCFEYANADPSSLKYTQLVSSSRDKVIIVWDLLSNTQLKTIAVHESVESFVILPSTRTGLDNRIVTMGSQGLLKLWDLQAGRCVIQQNDKYSLKIHKARQSKENFELESCIVQGIYNAKSKTIVLTTVDNLIAFIHVNEQALDPKKKDDDDDDDDNKPKQQLFSIGKQFIGSLGEIFDMSLVNQKENLLAMATNSEFVKIYDLNTWDCQLLKGHTDLVLCLTSFNNLKQLENEDGESKTVTHRVSYLASSSKDNTIRIWKLVETSGEASDASSSKYTHECVAVCQGHTQDVGAICFSNMSFDFLVSGSIDTTLKLWKIKKPKSDDSSLELTVAFTVKAHEKDINSICVSPNDKFIASGSSDRTAKIFDATDGTCLAVLRGHRRGIWSVKFSPVDQLIATSSADATIKLWSLTDFTCFKTFEGHNTSVLKVYFINHGTQMISSASDGLIKLWNIKTNECVSTFDEHSDKIWALSVTKNEERFITGGADGKLVLWKDVTTEEREKELEKREEILLQEQELENFLKEKKWKKALGLAILLGKPFRCYEIIKHILQQEFSQSEVVDGAKQGRLDLERTLLKLRDDQIKSLINYAIEWNTNTKFCHLAQILFEIVLRNYPPEFFFNEQTSSQDKKNGGNAEYAAKLVEQFMPYSERHFARLNKLSQQIMFIDFAWSTMKLDDSQM